VTDDGRWRGRPVLSALVSVAAFALPIALSIAAATLTAHLLPRPHGTESTLIWWAIVLVVPIALLAITERLARRALPLAVLLKMTMVFPDRAPRRLAVARRSGSTRDLARRIEEAKTQGLEDEPVLAAERILALAAALNAHDRLTRGHSERVRAYTDLISDELNLPVPDRDRLRWSALLHDIGKLAVHPHILNKPGTLDSDEWEIIKNHPLEGAKITAPLASWLGPWADTIAEHHEKYDGTGYPAGSKGIEISLGGRIVAVADSYDAMTAIRSYSRPMSAAAARAELAACAGAHFDPQVVRAFLDVSIGRMRPIAGPLAWLGSLPLISNIPSLGQIVSGLGQVGAALATVAGVAAVGTLQTVGQAAAVPHVGTAVYASAGPQSGGSGSSSGSPSGNGGTKRNDSRHGAPSVHSAGAPGSSHSSHSSGSSSTVPGGGGGGSGGGNGGGGGGPGTVGSGPGTGAGGPGTTTTTAKPPPSATAPGAPTGVTAVAGEAEVNVSWSAPGDGGSPITSYTVTPYVRGAAQPSHVFSNTATTELLTGLTNGVTYTFTVRATNAVGPSAQSSASNAVTPVGPSLEIVNGGAVAGRANFGDQIIVTFSPVPNVSAFCSAWNSTSYPDLVDPGVVVEGTQPSSGDGALTVTDTADCSGGFHFGTIDLGQRGYFNKTVTFGGNAGQCKGTNTKHCTRIHWNGNNTLTITLGQESSGQPTQAAPSVAVYTPDPALGLKGTIATTKEEHF
jgi:putative nucleotidyltransferase with HDIG domain